MKINQQLVDRIIKRAKNSDFGLGVGLIHKQGHCRIDQYADQDVRALAMLLVNGWDAKYDLISVITATLEILVDDAK